MGVQQKGKTFMYLSRRLKNSEGRFSMTAKLSSHLTCSYTLTQSDYKKEMTLKIRLFSRWVNYKLCSVFCEIWLMQSRRFLNTIAQKQMLSKIHTGLFLKPSKLPILLSCINSLILNYPISQDFSEIL